MLSVLNQGELDALLSVAEQVASQLGAPVHRRCRRVLLVALSGHQGQDDLFAAPLDPQAELVAKSTREMPAENLGVSKMPDL